jgi:hypothetical protein
MQIICTGANGSMTSTLPHFPILNTRTQVSHSRYYSLEVTQQPIRARMCGFGDKDRRPLAPAAVAKMIVRDKNDTILPPDDSDISFFVVTVDLWSEDGQQEMNLVLNPNSSDRYVPATQPRIPKPKMPPSASTNASRNPAASPSASSVGLGVSYSARVLIFAKADAG